jgi:hypothetical protein
MQNKTWLWLGVLLILFGVYHSVIIPLKDGTNIGPQKQPLNIKEPSEEMKNSVQTIINILKNGSNDRSIDGYKLAELYQDMSILIKSDNEILQTTESIRQANVLSAKMLQIDMQGKYPGLSDECDKLLKTYVSEDAVSLNDNLRAKSSEAFSALAWAFLEGSK